MEVMSKIKGSKNLQSYLAITEDLASQISPDMLDMVEDEKTLLDEKLSQSKFAFIILKNKYYENIDQQFKKFNQNARQNVKKVKELEKDIIAMSSESEALLLKAL